MINIKKRKGPFGNSLLKCKVLVYEITKNMWNVIIENDEYEYLDYNNFSSWDGKEKTTGLTISSINENDDYEKSVDLIFEGFGDNLMYYVTQGNNYLDFIVMTEEIYKSVNNSEPLKF